MAFLVFDDFIVFATVPPAFYSLFSGQGFNIGENFVRICEGLFLQKKEMRRGA